MAAAYLFGSVARGSTHRESDIDLAVLLDWKRYPDRRARDEAQLALMAELMQELGTNAVDLVILNDAPPLFGRGILFHGQRLHVADAEAARAWERDVQLRAADLEPFVRRMRQRVLTELAK